MPDLAANAEIQGLRGLDKLRTLAILAGAILLICVPRLTMETLFTRNDQSTNDAAIFIVAPMICWALMIATPLLMARRAPWFVMFDRTWVHWTWSELAWFWLLPLAYVVAVIPFGFLREWTGLPISWPVGFEHEFYKSRWLLVWLTIHGTLLAPVAEEFFWRGYVQSTLTRVFHPIAAIVVQAVLFGLYHYRPLLGTSMAVAPGLIFGIWCWRRKTLVPVIIAHMVINGVGYSNHWAHWRELIRIRPVHDYTADFTELSKPLGYEPNDDARQEYNKAFQLVVEPTKEIEDMRQRYPTLWSDEEKTLVETWLASNAKALELFEEGSRKRYYWPEYKYGRDRVPLFSPAHGKEMRSLGITLTTRALVIAAQDGHDKAISDVITCYRVGHHLLQCKDAMSQLLGMAINGLASQTARAILSRENIKTELLVNLQRQLEELAARQTARFDFCAERLFMLDAIQRLFTDDGHGGGRIPRRYFTSRESPREGLEYLLSDMAEAADVDIGDWRKLDRRSTTDDARQYYRALEEATSMAPWDYERNLSSYEYISQPCRLSRWCCRGKGEVRM